MWFSWLEFGWIETQSRNLIRYTTVLDIRNISDYLKQEIHVSNMRAE